MLYSEEEKQEVELIHMEFNGEISDTDSGIILHSGSDSPTTHTKDVTTHTRAMKLKHQALQDRLEICILELKKLCLREAELTGQLPDDYPLLPGEKPPQIRRRIGAAFKLDEQSIPQGTKETEMSLVDAELALQMKIYEAARKLCEEHHTSKAVRKSRLQQCKREEKKLKQLQESAFQLRLEHGRSSPLPAFNISQHDLGTSDDSSLSDSVVQDEEVTSQSSLQSAGLPYPGDTDPPQPQPPPQSSHSFVDGSYASPSAAPQSMQLSSCSSPHPSLESTQSLNSIPDYDLPPIQHSPWTESSLDQPYQKSKKSRSSSKKNTPTKTELLPPLEACLAPTSLPVQLSHLKLSRTQSNSTPSTPEMRVHRQLSLRLSNPESSLDKERGRTRGPRRRLTEYTITLPETLPPPLSYMNPTGSEDSNSEHSFTSYNSSPCQEFPCSSPHQYQPTVLHSSPVGSYGPQVYPRAGFYHNPRHQSSPTFHKAYYNEDMVYPPDLDLARGYYAQPALSPPNRYEYRYKDTAMSHQRAQRPPDVRLSPAPAQWDRPHYRSAGVSQQVVNEQLKSWHRRSQLKAPRSRSLDRQGAVRIKNMAARESSCYVNPKCHEQVVQRQILQRSADDSQTHWVVDDGSHYISQL